MITLISFLLAILILVSVHEFGHFWVARKLGVKVLRFSIGFGKVIFSKTSNVDGTEFVISGIPLGGYVKMLDEREGEVENNELHLAFNRKPLWVRGAVVFAGPLFNFIFAALAYWLIAVVGVNDIKPVIGKVEAESIAARAGVKAGATIATVGASKVYGWTQANEEILKTALDNNIVRLNLIDISGREKTVNLDSADFAKDPKAWWRNLGIQPLVPEVLPIIAQTIKGSPAGLAGLKAGDRITGINNKPVVTWDDLVAIVKNHPGQNLNFVIQNANGTSRSVQITPDTINVDGQKIGRIGISPQIPDTPEDMRVVVQYGPVAGLTRGVQQTASLSWLTLKIIWKMLIGESSFSQNIGGPVSIAQFAGSSFHAGFISFVGFLALISISLGVLNLLPIPVLDGGHLLLYLVEFIKGSPISENFEILFQKIGIVLIALLTFFAIFNDINRLLTN